MTTTIKITMHCDGINDDDTRCEAKITRPGSDEFALLRDAQDMRWTTATCSSAAFCPDHERQAEGMH